MTERTYPFSSEIGPLPPWLRSKTIPDAVAFLTRDRDKFSQAYTRTVFRIEKETQALKFCKELGLMSDVYYGFDNQAGDTPVSWNNPASVGDGEFDLLNGSITTHAAPPSKQEVLTTLAATGKFPITVDMLTHELAHRHQIPANAVQRLAVLMAMHPAAGDRFFPGKEVMEVIAYRITTQEPHEATPATLSEHLLTATDREQRLAYAGFDSQKVAAAISAVDSLLALDIDTLSLCRLAYQPSGWDAASHSFPHLDRAVATLAQERHQPLTALPLLKNRYIVKRLSDTNTCAKIAQTEILSGLTRPTAS